MSNTSRTAFVMMPFNKTKPIRHAIVKALESEGILAILIDEVKTTHKISDAIERQIRDAHVCICDVTGKNPNVAWEYGYASALGKKVILISPSVENLYFDIQNNSAIIYDLNNLDKLTQSIKTILREIDKELDFFPNDWAISSTYPEMHLTSVASVISQTPYNCFDMISNATEHVFLAGQNHGFISQSEANKDAFKVSVQDFLDKSPKAKFDIMMCNEDADFAIKTWEYILDTKHYERHLRDSITYFQELKDFLERKTKYRGRFTVRKFDFVPLSIMFTDPMNEKAGLAVVTPNGFQKSNINKPCFILSRKNDREVFHNYWQQYYHFFTAMPSIEITRNSKKR